MPLALGSRALRPAMAILVMASGCGSDDAWSTALRDTSGAAFQHTCDEGRCSLSPGEGTPAPLGCGTGTPAYASAWSRFFEICDVAKDDDGWSSTPALCRLVACHANSDCPRVDVTTAYVCISGLCQKEGSSGNLVNPREAEALCVSDAPRPRTCAEAFLNSAAQAAVELVDRECPGVPRSMPSCTVPASCRQP
jgi:hypothetical protein